MNRPGAPTRCGPPLFEDRYSLRLAAGDGVLRVTRKEGVGDGHIAQRVPAYSPPRGATQTNGPFTKGVATELLR